MATIDIYGSEVTDAVGEHSITDTRLEAPLAMLLPNGFAWEREHEGLRKLVATLATELSRVAKRADHLVDVELVPSKTTELIDEWETMFGLPDCDGEPTDLASRRTALVLKILAQVAHSQGLDYWTLVFENLGLAWDYLNKGGPIFDSNSECDDYIKDGPWAFVLQILVQVVPGVDQTLVECTVEHAHRIHAFYDVHWMWRSASSTTITDIRGMAANEGGYIVMVGPNQILYSAEQPDGGWDGATPPVVADYYAVAAVKGGRFVSVGEDAVGAAVSDDGGATWTSNVIGGGLELYAVTRADDDSDYVIAVGENGRAFYSADLGNMWSEAVTPVVDYLYGLGIATGAVVACGDSGSAIRSTDQGLSWSAVTTGVASRLEAVAGYGSTMIIVGDGGVILRSDDAGATWSTMTSGTVVDLYAVVGGASERWAAAGDGGLVLYSYDDGVTWAEAACEATDQLRAAASAWPNGQKMFAGDNGSLVLE